jgi:curli biogenesis system outer membrane secretion channel CsgG
VLDYDYWIVQSSSAAFFGSDIDVGKRVTNLLITDLVRDGNFSVIERQAL